MALRKLRHEMTSNHIEAGVQYMNVAVVIVDYSTSDAVTLQPICIFRFLVPDTQLSQLFYCWFPALRSAAYYAALRKNFNATKCVA